MMRNEKPGGHGERAVAVAALDIAVWDAAAKLRDMPLWALIAEDAGNAAPERSIPVYAAGGYYDPEKGIGRTRRRDAALPGSGLQHR